MRPASYLSTSRHGVFYLRLPIPRSAHPERRRTDLKVSLATREPRVAATLSQISGKALVKMGQWGNTFHPRLMSSVPRETICSRFTLNYLVMIESKILNSTLKQSSVAPNDWLGVDHL